LKLDRFIRAALPCALLTALAVATSPAALAQAWPSKQITMIVPFGPGTVTDILARTVGNKLAENLGQPVVVENRAGADGNIGAQYAASAAADGYTLLVGPTSVAAINVSLHKNLRYDPQRDFVPITNLATVTNVLVVGPHVKARNVKDFIAAAKAQPFNYASSGAGGSMHLSAEMFKRAASVDMQHIPYKSTPAAVNDVMGGRVEAIFCNLPVCLPHIKNGRLTALAVTSAKRSTLLPDVPTVQESGIPNFAVEGWFGLFAPAGTNPAIVKKLHGVLARILQDPKVKELLLAQGAEPVGDTPEQFAAFAKSERERWAKVIVDAKISLD
jgi:tripartite-type tricarboxylate transporter receptor subunit TctC